MTSPNDKFKKLMFSFIDDGVTSGSYGPRLYAPKKLWNGYILAIRAKHQRPLTNAERLLEWAVFLDWCKLKGRPFPQTNKEFSSVRFTFFNALPKCRCLSVVKGSFVPLKNFSQYGFHPEKNYKYYLFTCEPRSLPDWPVNLIEEPIPSNDEQEVPNNILGQAMHEANIEGSDYNFDEPDNGGIDEIPELINHRNQSNQENVNNAISKVSNAEMMRVLSPVAHAAKQEPPNANAVALLPSQQTESNQVPLNSTDMIVDSPETPEYAVRPVNNGRQRGENFTPVSSPLDKTEKYVPMRSDSLENASMCSRPLFSDAPLKFYNPQTQIDPISADYDSSELFRCSNGLSCNDESDPSGCLREFNDMDIDSFR